MENQNQNTALTMRLQQAEEIKQVVECFIPETTEKQAIFAKNCQFYLIKNKAQMVDGNILINYEEKEVNGKKITKGTKVDLFEFCQKMYLASKAGLSLIDGEFSFITYDGGEVVVVPDFRAEKRIAEEKGLTIGFVHGRKGDTFTIEPDPLKHTFNINSHTGKFAEIKTTKKVSKQGKEYSVNEVQNDILWYGVIAKVNETGEEFSYVESTQNIILRANPKTQQFYSDPNAKDTMFEKFVLRQLIKRLPSNLRGIDFDKWEGKFENIEEAEIVEEAPKPKTPPTQAKLPLVKGSETWAKMETAIKAGKVKDIAPIERKYEVAEDDRNEILSMLMEYCEPASEPANEDNPMSLFK